MHQNSKLLFGKYARRYFCPDMQILEIGPDAFPSSYQTIVGDNSLVWDTLDICEYPNLTYVASKDYSFPIADNSYDIVLSGQVLEHVKRIWIWIKEVARVCKEGGLVITINPASWPYHEAPVDCWRVFPEGMKALYEEAGLKVIMSTFESLEVPCYRRYIPGRSPEVQGKKQRMANRLLGKLGFPVERAYDTITIGEKVHSGV